MTSRDGLDSGRIMATKERPDVDVVRSVYDAVGRGDVDRAVAALDEDVEWIEPEGGPFDGTYRGPEAVAENVFAGLGDEWDEFAVEPDRFVADDGTVVALVTHHGTRAGTGETYEAPVADVRDLDDGTITRFRHYVGSVRYAERRGEP
jgi:hypothetical protein